MSFIFFFVCIAQIRNFFLFYFYFVWVFSNDAQPDLHEPIQYYFELGFMISKTATDFWNFKQFLEFNTHCCVETHILTKKTKTIGNSIICMITLNKIKVIFLRLRHRISHGWLFIYVFGWVFAFNFFFVFYLNDAQPDLHEPITFFCFGFYDFKNRHWFFNFANFCDLFVDICYRSFKKNKIK